MKGIDMECLYWMVFTECRNTEKTYPFWLVNYHMSTDSFISAEEMVDHLLKTTDVARVSVWIVRRIGEVRQVAMYHKHEYNRVNLLYSDGYHAEYGAALCEAMADLHRKLTANKIVTDAKGQSNVLDSQTVP